MQHDAPKHWDHFVVLHGVRTRIFVTLILTAVRTSSFMICLFREASSDLQCTYSTRQ